jgi:hypothetical protein
MALATTTLSSAVAATDVNIVVASATSIAVGRLLLVDQEVMQVAQSWTSGTTIPVLRGREGTVGAAHKATANVTHGLASDFSAPTPGLAESVTYPISRGTIIQSLSASATLTLPAGGSDLRLILNGTGAITLTVPVPTKDMDGCELSIVSNGVAQHLLTFTGGLSGAGSNYDVITINATAPAAFKFIACNGLWLAYCGPAMGGTVTNIIGSVA